MMTFIISKYFLRLYYGPTTLLVTYYVTKNVKLKVLCLFIQVERKDRHEINKLLKLLEDDNVGIRKC